MSPERWERVEALFEAAAERPPAERGAYLGDACGGDAELRREVEALLEADSPGETFLEAAVLGGVDLWTERGSDSERLGPYRLLRRLGYGGMGVVYLAERADEEYEQQVALKVIRPGVDGRAVLERFRAERQILAGLEHPHIARLLDGGTAADGRPYLVMEHIDGVPLDRYCDERRLGVDERLELFLAVCDAVQYAHQNLVIHRDLKPSNILVTADGTVKLLDFGIAKLLSPETAVAGADPTVTADRPLTLNYASPEQVRGERVTVASDVYSLGVVLYELLIGRRPFDLTDVAPQEAFRLVCEAERRAPSVALAESAGDTEKEEVSRLRGTRPERLSRRLRGDLDTIALAALHKDRSRRYGSAARLADDLRRHLEGRPVLARPDSFGYRTGKFLRRNRLPLAVAAAFMAVVTGSWVSRSQQAVWIAQERDKARQVAEFLVEIFEVSDPSRSRGETVTARELLDEGAARLVELEEQPLVRAMLSDTIGRVYHRLGLYEEARLPIEEALAVRREILGEAHPDVAESLAALAAVLQEEADYSGAEERFRQALGIYDRLGDRARNAADVRVDLAMVLRQEGRYDASEALLYEALAAYRSLPEEAPAHEASTLNNLAMVLEERGDFERAEERLREALELAREAYGEPHRVVAQQLSNLAVQQTRSGNFDAAEALYHEALEMKRRVLGAEHPDVQESLNNLATLLYRMGDYAGAEKLFREALDLVRGRLGEDHPDVTANLSNLALILSKNEDWSGAEEVLREVLRLRRLRFGDEHPEVARSLSNLAGLLYTVGDHDAAEPLYVEALGIRRRVLGEGHPQVALNLSHLARIYQWRGRLAEAASLQEQALAIQRRHHGEEHHVVAGTLASLAAVHAAAGRLKKAEELYRASLEQRRKLLETGHPDLAVSLTGLGEVLTEQGRVTGAEEALREALDIRLASVAEGHWRIAEVRSALGACLVAQGRLEEAEELLRGSYEVLKEKRGADHQLTAKAAKRLVAFYDASGRGEEAGALRARD